MSDIAIRRLYSWALESHVAGVISSTTLREAAEQFSALSGGRAQVWLLDAGDATDYDDDVLPALHEMCGWLMEQGLEKVAIVVPERARLGLMLLAPSMPILVRPFGTETEALYWIQQSCPND